MKLFPVLAVFALLISLTNASAQINTPAASPSATVSQVIGLSKVTVEYSRPMLKGRQMVGSKLIPYGQIWRTGANKITNLTLSNDMAIEGKSIKAGTYGLVTVPGEKKWTVVLSKNANQWGTYNYKSEEDLMRFDVEAGKTNATVEQFSFSFVTLTPASAHLIMQWENTEIKMRLSHDAEAGILKEIDEKTSAAEVTSETYYDAANYYFEHDKDLTKAYAWANKLVEMDKKYWTYYVRAKIAAKLGKCDVALADAQAGLVDATKDNDQSYVENLQRIIQQCSGK
ncbi:MAG: DUF2911 domain-containing protein [Saprospiraceae bacterium]|nr:DUF2911 domain-containing protein [Saprospiraceae bacterium]